MEKNYRTIFGFWALAFLLLTAQVKGQTPGGASGMVFRFTKQVWLNPTIILAKQNFEQSTNVKLLILPRLNGNDTTGSSKIEKAFDKLLSFLVYKENVQGSIKFYFNPKNPTKPFTFNTSDELFCKFTPIQKDSVETILNQDIINSSNLNNFTALPFDSIINRASRYCKKILQSKPGQCGENPGNEFTLTKINSAPAKLNFEKTTAPTGNVPNGGVDKQKYAELAQYYNTVLDVADNSNYPMAWKAMAANKNDNIKLKLKKKQGYFDINKLVFKNAAGNETYNVTYSNVGNDSTIDLSMSGKSPGSIAEVVAYYTPTTTPTQTFAIGAFNVQFYEPKTMNVVLVNLGGATLPDANTVKNSINAIYGNVFINWNVTTAACNLPANISKSIHVENSSLLSNYMPDMQPIVSYFKDHCSAYNGSSDNTFYLLFGASNDGNLAGYMPRARNTGFIFDNDARTIAHELGHGAFNLKHIFSDEELGAGNRTLTDNLMDYATESKLYKHQWDLVHNPSSVGWFEGDNDDGAAYGPSGGIPEKFRAKDRSVSFLTPSKKIIKLPKEILSAYLSFGLGEESGFELAPSGVLKQFTIKENGQSVTYVSKIQNKIFYGYFNNNQPFLNYITPVNQSTIATGTYTCDNTAIYRLVSILGSSYYQLNGLTALSYYNGQSEPVIDLLDYSGSACNLNAQSWDLLVTYEFSKNQVSQGLGDVLVNEAYTDIMSKMGSGNSEKNEQSILMTKILELRTVYPDILKIVSTWNSINKWDVDNPVSGTFYNTNTMSALDAKINSFLNGSLLDVGYFNYQVDSANWSGLSKQQLLARFIKAFITVRERLKTFTAATAGEMLSSTNCSLPLNDPNNTIQNLLQKDIDDAVTGMSVDELKTICPNTRAQLIAMLLNGAVFNGTERSIYRLMHTCPPGAIRADFLVALEKTKDKNGKYILKNLVKSVDDRTLFVGSDYNTWIMNFFIQTYPDLLKYHTSTDASAYYTTYIQPNLLTSLEASNQYKVIRDHYYTYNYANFVKRLFKQVVASSAGGLGSLVVSGDYKSVVDYDENTGKLSYSNQLVKGFQIQAVTANVSNISAFEPMVVDVKGNLLGNYTNAPQGQMPCIPAIILMFAEAKADSKTTQDAIQTGVDLVSLAIPGGQATMLLKVLNYADKLSAVSSIIATSQAQDNPQLASALNVTSAVLGIASLTSLTSVSSISDIDQAAALVNKSETVLSSANHETNVTAMCTKIIDNNSDALNALSKPSSKKILEDVVNAEIDAAKEAGKYTGTLKTKLDNAYSIIKLGYNKLTSSGLVFFNDVVSNLSGFSITSGFYKKGTQTVAHLNGGELVVDATTDINTLSNNAELLEYADDITFKKADNLSPVTDDILLFDDNGVIKCISGTNCFVKNTLIKTIQGLKPIQNITTTDTVLSYNTQNSKNEYYKVKQIFTKTVTKLQRLIAGTDTIIATPEHKFYVSGQWLKASALVIGTTLQLSNNSTANVISNITFDSTATVYNFEVEHNHNYYIGKQSILVHNDCAIIGSLVNSGKLSKAKAAEFAKDFAGNEVMLNKFVSGELDVRAWEILSNSARTGLKTEEAALKAVAKLKANPKFAEMGLTDQIIGDIKSHKNTLGDDGYAEVLNDIDQLGKNMANNNVTLTNFQGRLSTLTGNNMNARQGVHGVIKELAENPMDYANKTVQFEKGVTNAGGNTSFIDVYSNDIAPKLVEVKWITSGDVTQANIVDEFIRRDLYTAVNFDQIIWKVRGNKLTIGKLNQYLSSTDGVTALQNLGKSKIGALLNQDYSLNTLQDAVNDIISHLNNPANFSKIFK